MMKNTELICVNIDAGLATVPHFINIDVTGKGKRNIDIGKEPLPFDNDSVDVIFSYHALEHIPNYLAAMAEIHRVLKHGGRLLLGLPYVTATKYHLVNPYHLHNFNEHSFDFFDKDKFANMNVPNPVVFKKVFHRFHYTGMFNYLPSPIQNWCRNHLLNVVQKIDVGLLAIKQTDAPLSNNKEQLLLQEFSKCFAARVPYKAN